jgi:beta-galactosidase
VRQAADIWVNGKKVGFSENGVMAFGVDITSALRPGDNVIAVRVDNHWDYRERATGTKSSDRTEISMPISAASTSR